jgi:glycosyltransferase involved in cell wall biosynthesis
VLAVPTVLVAHPSADVYGSDLQLLESLTGLLEGGHDVRLVLPAGGPLVDRLPGGIALQTRAVPVLRKALLRPRALAALLLRTPVELYRLARSLRRARPDVVYVNTVTLPHWIFAARLARVPVLVHVHEAEELSRPLVRKVLYAPLLAARRVIANSETTRAVVLAAHPRLARRTVVVPNGVPDPGPQPESAVEIDHLVVVSRLSPRKGIDVALEAVARLRRGGRAVTLQLCGTPFAGYEWFEEQLRRRAARDDLAGAVEFAGYVSPPSQALRRASVVLVPSLGESFGNAAVEAMLARRPVVASGVQGLAEVIEDGQSGLLVAPGDPVALADAVERLLTDRQFAQRIAVQGRDRAVELYSVERYRRAIAAQVVDMSG